MSCGSSGSSGRSSSCSLCCGAIKQVRINKRVNQENTLGQTHTIISIKQRKYQIPVLRKYQIPVLPVNVYRNWSNVDVSKNNGTPKSSILIGFSIINHPFWWFSPYFWKHLCKKNLCCLVYWSSINCTLKSLNSDRLWPQFLQIQGNPWHVNLRMVDGSLTWRSSKKVPMIPVMGRVFSRKLSSNGFATTPPHLF